MGLQGFCLLYQTKKNSASDTYIFHVSFLRFGTLFQKSSEKIKNKTKISHSGLAVNYLPKSRVFDG
jgi:hypothetical protein